MAVLKSGSGVMEQILTILHGTPANLIMRMRMLFTFGRILIFFGTAFLLETYMVVFLIRDCYHQIEEIGPKKFGTSTIYSIGKFLRCRLLSKAGKKWDEVCNQAIEVIAGNTHSVSILMTISKPIILY